VRALLGGGWLMLLAAFAASVTAQSNVASALDALARDDGARVRTVSSGAAGALALWLIVGGLALVAFAVLTA
jgi:hypothetical protein